MNAPARLAAFGAVLGLALGGSALAGAVIDPADPPAQANAGHGNAPVTPADEAHAGQAGGEARTSDAHGGTHAGTGPAAGGLAVSAGGYTLQADRTYFASGRAAPFAFRVTDAHGRVVRDEFEVEHDKRLHLIVVRRDTAVFEHVHPRQARDGTWTIDLDLRAPGVYRAYADFKLDGQRRTLATDLFVPGDFQPRRLPAPATTAAARDSASRQVTGIEIGLDAPGLRAGRSATLTFTASRDGRPFTGLEPYLGAKGHLVALREGDLAYLHVHPTAVPVGHGDTDDKPTAGSDGAPSPPAVHDEPSGATPGDRVPFAATFPTPGRYRLFLQVKTSGKVRTAAFTLEVPR